MKTVQYRTGRQYNGDQVLSITYQEPSDVYGLEDVAVSFKDASRNISGTVKLMEMQCDRDIGRAVLREYDAGRYELV